MIHNRKMKKEEKTFLANYNPKNYDRPSVTVDTLLFSIIDGSLNILLIKRGNYPFKNYWAIPGGFVGINESSEAAAYRELKEETGVNDVYLEQLYTFSEVGRDPRMRVISISNIALVSADKLEVNAGDDAIDATWFQVNDLLRCLETEDLLAFDHEDILRMAVNRLRGKLFYTDIAFKLLSEKFTISELRNVFEEILNQSLHPSNFRREIIHKLVALGEVKDEGKQRKRPAELYRLNHDYFSNE